MFRLLVYLYVSRYWNMNICAMTSTVKSLRVLSDATRLRLLVLVAEEEVTVAELQEIVSLGQSRISTGLSLLRREGLVTTRRVGKNVFYSASKNPPAVVQAVMDAAKLEAFVKSRDKAALALVLRKRKNKAAEYFNKLAGRFGRVYVPGRSWQALAHAILAVLPPLDIADLGAGEGTLAQLLAPRAKSVVAVDTSRKMVAFGRAMAKKHGLKNLKFLQGDVEALPINPNSVDLALFSQVLHHVTNPSKAITSAHSILRPNGRILILDLASHREEKVRELYAHLWLGFSEVELYEMLDQAGFTRIEISIVSRETSVPHFQTLLATALKSS